MRLLLLAIGAWLVGCTTPPGPTSPEPVSTRITASAAPSPAPRVTKLSIVGTNDLHGHVERLPAFAGYVARLREVRAKDGGLLVLDAGDLFQGTLESNLNEGKSVIAAYDAIGYAAAAIGNHDFDYGPVGDDEPSPGHDTDRQGALRERLTEASFPLLSTNLVTTGGLPPAWQNLESDVKLVDVAGVRVGIVGGLTEETPSIVMPAYFAGLSVRSLSESIARAAEHARARGAHVVIAVVHAGGECTRFDDPNDATSCDNGEAVRMTRALRPGLVDVVVAGHTHKGMAHFFGGVPVVESYAYGRAFSRVDVVVPPDPKAQLELHVFPPQELCRDAAPGTDCVPGSYEGGAVTPSAEVARVIAPFVEAAKARREERLGVEIAEDVEGSYKQESPLGNLFADLMVEAVPGADLAVMNGGGLRAPLRKGELSYGELYEAQPFDNRMATLKLTGAELRALLVHHFERPRHGLLSFGGVNVVARCKGATLELKITRKNGKPVGDTDRVTLVLSDYLATGGDELTSGFALAPGALSVQTETVRDAIAARLRARGGSLRPDDPKLFDPKHPRLSLPMPRPVKCR